MSIIENQHNYIIIMMLNAKLKLHEIDEIETARNDIAVIKFQ